MCNLKWAEAPENVLLAAWSSGLSKDSVVVGGATGYEEAAKLRNQEQPQGLRSQNGLSLCEDEP